LDLSGHTRQLLRRLGHSLDRKQRRLVHRAPGASLTGFNFTSAETFATLSANSPFYPTTPVGTSFLYIGAPFADPGQRIIATVIPAPVSACALAGLALPLLRRRRA
jgi:hypothetical protein